MLPPHPKIHFVLTPSLVADGQLERLSEKYGQHPPESADVIVVWSGDGLMLEMLHRFREFNKPFYGIQGGTVGFLMNQQPKDLLKQLHQAEHTQVHLLNMCAETQDGGVIEATAINEVSLFRASGQAAKVRVSVNGTIRLRELICDGIMLSTPAGSTAYNLSVGGPILPLGAPLVVLTPISPFRPRRWRGAILPDTAIVSWHILESSKRPVSVVADSFEVKNVSCVTVRKDPTRTITLLFDPHHDLEERILREQFSF